MRRAGAASQPRERHRAHRPVADRVACGPERVRAAPQPDEGTPAHLFQLSIVALVPMIVLFFATADWRQPWRSARPLRFATVAVALAFGALYYLEHYR
jgi:hypothetical protein